MLASLPLTALTAAAVATGLVAGVFLAFSDFVMRALNTATPEAGMLAMQWINRKVYGSVFLTLFMALAPASAALAIWTVATLPAAAALWTALAAGIYLVGVFGVTVIANVPMNKRLDALPAGAVEGRTYWTEYARLWTGWNHVRTIASAAATICFTLALAAAA